MSRNATTGDPDAPRDIVDLATRARVVVFRSNLTDTRRLEAWLADQGIDHEVVTMGMGSSLQRDRFHRLRDWAGWNLLPIVFVDGRFVGGADEFFETCADDPGALRG